MRTCGPVAAICGRGETVVDAGVLLGAAHIAALAAGGAAQLTVARRPRVAVLTTGTELRPPGASWSLARSTTRTGRCWLRSCARQAGSRSSCRRSPTMRRHTGMRCAEGSARDVLVTSGGVSVGPHDLVRGVGVELGVEEVFWRIAMRPGKPLWFGVRGNTLVFGLPGNPVSSLVCFELFVRPALLALQGHRSPAPPFEPGTLGATVRRERRAGRPRPGAPRGRDARARARPGVAHDRAGRRGRRTGARPPRRGRARRGRHRAVSADLKLVREPRKALNAGFFLPAERRGARTASRRAAARPSAGTRASCRCAGSCGRSRRPGAGTSPGGRS